MNGIRAKEENRRTIYTFWRKSITVLMLAAVALAGCSGGGTNDAAPMMASAPSSKVDTFTSVTASDQMAESRNVRVATDNTESGAMSIATNRSSAAPGGVAAAGISSTVDPAAAVTNRKVIYKANVVMKVPDFNEADEKLQDLIHLSGSYILQFSNQMHLGEKGASYVIKVPADGFSNFVDQLRQIEPQFQLQMEGSDVTEEFVDLEARLQAKQVAEARLLAFMDKAERSDDLIRFQSELTNVQEQIEQLKGRMRYLEQNVAYSTVNVRLNEINEEAQVEMNKQGLGERIMAALASSTLGLGKFGETLLVIGATLLPILLLLAAIALPVYRIARKRSLQRRANAAEKRKQWNANMDAAASTPPDQKQSDAEQTDG